MVVNNIIFHLINICYLLISLNDLLFIKLYSTKCYTGNNKTI